MPSSATINSEQTIEVGVNGPGDVTRMHVVNGIAQCYMNVSSPAGGSWVTNQETFEALVGPTFTTADFRRAVATASLTSLRSDGGDAAFAQWEVTGVDADFDDDSGRVQLQFDLRVRVDAGSLSASAFIGGVGIQVIILSASSS